MTVYNERVKLLAAALNGTAVASVAVGVIAPLVVVFHFGTSRDDPFWTAVEVSIWMFAAIALHLFAQLALSRMSNWTVAFVMTPLLLLVIAGIGVAISTYLARKHKAERHPRMY